MNIDNAKRAVRERVWAALDKAGAVEPPGAAGHIPSFVGAEQAAERLAGLESWARARVVKANPDQAQLPVRRLALEQGKVVYMAVPRIATLKPFYALDPATVDPAAVEAKRAKDLAPLAGLDEMRPVDFIVCGTVAVNRQGVRLGKGAGYSDIEVALLTEAGLIGPDTTIVTTVHQLQVVDEELPETEHDFSVDWIVTPEVAIRCEGASRRPKGLVREHLTAEKIKAIPVLLAQFDKS
ncbi:5-formyltetrahydrofolate cyclo-ligase [Actinokineospora sp. 24-640]